MSSAFFLGLLLVFGTLTSLIVEAIKIYFGENKQIASNFLVFIVSLVVGIGGTAIFYIFTGIPFIAINILSMILMGPAVWLGSMVGYDKVTQCINQIIELKLK